MKYCCREYLVYGRFNFDFQIKVKICFDNVDVFILCDMYGMR